LPPSTTMPLLTPFISRFAAIPGFLGSLRQCTRSSDPARHIDHSPRLGRALAWQQASYRPWCVIIWSTATAHRSQPAGPRGHASPSGKVAQPGNFESLRASLYFVSRGATCRHRTRSCPARARCCPRCRCPCPPAAAWPRAGRTTRIRAGTQRSGRDAEGPLRQASAPPAAPQTRGTLSFHRLELRAGSLRVERRAFAREGRVDPGNLRVEPRLLARHRAAASDRSSRLIRASTGRPGLTRRQFVVAVRHAFAHGLPTAHFGVVRPRTLAQACDALSEWLRETQVRDFASVVGTG